MNNWRSLAWRTVMAFLLLLLLGVPTLALLFSVGACWPGRTAPSQDVNPWRALLASEKGFSRSIVLSLSEDQLTVEYAGTFDGSGPTARHILEGGLEDVATLGTLIEVAFGTLELDDGAHHRAEYAPPRWEVDPETHAVRLRLQASMRVGASASGVLKRSPDAPAVVLSDEFRLNHGGARLLRFTPVPDETAKEYVSLRRPAPLPTLTFGVEPPGRGSTRESARALVGSYGGLSGVPLLFDLMKGVGRALPFVLFLLFTRKPPPEEKERIQVLRHFSLTFFHYTVLLWFLTGAQKALHAWEPMRRLSTQLEGWVLAHSGVVALSPILPRGLSALIPALVGVILPGFLFGRLREARAAGTQAKPAGRAWLLGTSFCAICVMAVAVPLPPGSTSWKYALAFGLGALLLLWVLLSALLGVLQVWPYRTTTALLAMVTIALTAGLMTLPPHVSRAWRDTGWKLLDTALTVLLLLSLVDACRQFATAGTRGTPAPLSRLTRGALVLGSLVLAYPLATPRWTFSEYDLLSFFVACGPFFGWLWMAGVLWLLRVQGKEGLSIAPLPRALGLLAFSATLFGYSSPASGRRILTLVLGWLLFEYVVVRPSSRWSALQRLVKAAMQDRPGLLQKLLDLNALENAYVSSRQKSRERLANGELSFDEFQKGNQLAWSQLTAAREDNKVEELTAREIVLAFGPERTAWANGMRGVIFGILFALPWILIAAWNLLNQPRSPEPYPFWSLAQSLGAVFVHWAIIGFLFGYFFPYIRGSSGLSKGLWIFTAIVMPLSLTALMNLSTEEQSHALLFWMTQAFIQLLSLGLFAFDHATLRRSGYRSWRLVFEVHDLPTVGLSLSSLLVAIGMAVTTTLQSNASRLVTLALQFILPSPTP